MNDQHYIRVASLLIDVESALRQLRLWSSERPSAEALASQQPFCIDTLSFPEWLQHIFLVRMRQLVETRGPLPGQCGIAPMAEEYFRGQAMQGTLLVEALQRIDEELTAGSGG